MRRDVRHLLPEDIVVPVHHMVEPVLPVHGHFWHSVIVQEKETTVTVDDLFNRWRFPRLQDPLEALANLVAHRQPPCTRIRLGFLNDIVHITHLLQLSYACQLRAGFQPLLFDLRPS